jgi:hypothetical protein
VEVCFIIIIYAKRIIKYRAIGTLSCAAQNVPAAVKKSFEKNFPGIVVKKWDKENDKYEASFNKDGKTMSALLLQMVR